MSKEKRMVIDLEKLREHIKRDKIVLRYFKKYRVPFSVSSFYEGRVDVYDDILKREYEVRNEN